MKRSTGHQVVRVATSHDGDIGLAAVAAGRDGHTPGNDYTEVRVGGADDPQAVLRGAMAHGGDVLRFEVADPSLEEVFVTRVGALDDRGRTLAAVGEAPA